MGMKLLAGRDFHADGVGDSSSVIVNETLAWISRKPDEAVGRQIDRRDGGKPTVAGG